jgi:hypothetical protein
VCNVESATPGVGATPGVCNIESATPGVGATPAVCNIESATPTVGAAPGVDAVRRTNASAAAGGKLDAATLRTQTKEALMGLGWKPTIATAAAAEALAAVGTDATLERLIFDALRRCPKAATSANVIG